MKTLTQIVAVLAGCAVSCARSPSPGDETPSLSSGDPQATGTIRGAVTAPFDLGAVIRRVHVAFRPDGEGFAGGHSTFGVRVARNGSFSVQPYPPPSEAAGPSGARRPPARASAVEGEALRIGTTQIERGSRVLSGGAGQTRDDGTGGLTIDRGVATEYLRKAEEGVEQSWSFRRAPAGSGDLVIRLRVSGQSYAGKTVGGLHFRDERAGIGLRYGVATWIDARGIRTPVDVSFERDELRLRVPAALVESSAYPAVLDPTISPEFAIDQPVLRPAWSEQNRPAIDFDGTNYFVVWSDRRSTTRYDVYGTRVNLSGTVLDPRGILIATSGEMPAVAWNGSHYLVVWADRRNYSTSGYDVYGARVTSQGLVEGPEIPIATTSPNDQWFPAVASGGSGGDWLVMWEDFPTPSGYRTVWARRVSQGGGLLGDALGLIIGSAPAVAFDGTNYLMAWTDYRYKKTRPDIAGARMSKAGVVIDSSPIDISTGAQMQDYAAVAFDGENFVVAWQDYRSRSSYDVYAARVSRAGSLLDSKGIPVATTSSGDNMPAIASNGAGSLIVWSRADTSGTDVYGVRLSQAGVVLDPSPLAVSRAAGAQLSPAVAWGADGGYLAAWSDGRGSRGTDIYGARVSAAGSVLDSAGLLLSADGFNFEMSMRAAFDGQKYLVVWQDSRLGFFDIYGAFVKPDGSAEAPFLIAAETADRNRALLDPTVAFDGTNYLVVWWRDGLADVFGALVGTDGTVRKGPIPISNVAGSSQLRPSVACGATNCLVAWMDERGANLPYRSIFCARVARDGTVLDPGGIQVAPLAERGFGSALVGYDAVSREYLVAWAEVPSGGAPNTEDIRGARVKADGTVRDPGGFLIAGAANRQRCPNVAASPDGLLVTWDDDLLDGIPRVYATRLDLIAENPVRDPGGILIASPGRDNAVAYDGTNYVVTWLTSEGKVYGTRLSRDAKVLDSPPLDVSGENNRSSLGPAVASDGAGNTLVLYGSYPSSPWGPYLRARFIRE